MLAGLNDVLDDGAEDGEEEEDGVEDADELAAGGAAEEAAALPGRVRQAAHYPPSKRLPPRKAGRRAGRQGGLPDGAPPKGALKRPRGNAARRSSNTLGGRNGNTKRSCRTLLETDPMYHL